MQLTSDQMILYVKDMYKVMNEKYNEKKTQYQNIFYVRKDGTDGSGDKETGLLGADKFRRKTVQGEGFKFRSPVQGWQTFVKYETFFDAVKFDKEEVEDNVRNGNIGRTLQNYAKSWGEAYRVTKEEFAAAFFNKGGYTSGNSIFNGSFGDQVDPSGDLLYDGKPFFNLVGNLRTAKDGSTYYNSVTASDLNESNFDTLYNLMAVTNAKNEVGVITENRPDTILTQDGTIEREAWKLVNSAKLPGGQLNDANPYNNSSGMEYMRRITPIAWSYLSGGAWYVGKRNDERLCFEDRQAPVTEFYRNKDTRAYMATVDTRFGVHLKAGVWRLWTRNGGSAAASE